ncbi:MAG: CYTH domain-containing protein [Minisyncoccia bacterium]
MIEVEKKFQPTKKELEKLLEKAEFLGEKINHDVYYDYPDYRLIKNRIRLRIRNNLFELKIGKDSGISEEIDDEEKIKDFFKTELSIKEFIKKNLILFIEYKTKRNKYKKGQFVIDIDKCDFGYEVVEIEKLIETEDKIKETEDQINMFAVENGLSFKTIDSKRNAYLKKMKPDVYLKIFK